MRIKIQQFLFGKSHSWSIVGQNIGRSLIKMGHNVEFVSTDGFDEKYCPSDLRPHVRHTPQGEYDCQISYTAPHNWEAYLCNGKKNRFGIWNFEYKLKDNVKTTLLSGFAKNHHYTDLCLPSSEFSKIVFRDMGIPDEKIVVLPHGFNEDEFKSQEKWALKTKKSKKILLNINQPHRRKNLPGALDVFGKAFDKSDDVCLVAKIYTANNKGTNFDIDFYQLLKTFKNKYKNHAEIEVVTEFIPNISELYNACDINFSCTHTECYHLPSIEALASGLINVVPRYGGQLDFCNDSNSLLIEGKEVRAPRDHIYWKNSPYVVHFEIDKDDAVNKLKEAVFNYDEVMARLLAGMLESKKFTWDNVAEQIIKLCQ